MCRRFQFWLATPTVPHAVWHKLMMGADHHPEAQAHGSTEKGDDYRITRVVATADCVVSEPTETGDTSNGRSGKNDNGFEYGTPRTILL